MAAMTGLRWFVVITARTSRLCVSKLHLAWVIISISADSVSGSQGRLLQRLLGIVIILVLHGHVPVPLEACPGPLCWP